MSNKDPKENLSSFVTRLQLCEDTFHFSPKILQWKTSIDWTFCIVIYFNLNANVELWLKQIFFSLVRIPLNFGYSKIEKLSSSITNNIDQSCFSIEYDIDQSCYTILEMNLSFSTPLVNGWLHLEQLWHVTVDIFSSSLTSSSTSLVSSSEIFVLLSDFLSFTADVTLVITTWKIVKHLRGTTNFLQFFKLSQFFLVFLININGMGCV